ncbi:hypothetical protein BU16DRAFT_234290 [Lophium mytilinum]|uniref:Uncharacterized protein n=1 Tax=Lophium mytilinum TaxID=390894 RepID=A0A6A6R6B9_9PEZI|nr:hypothetical protein BU16DRAFT_234290 [Lophium mytilinum]
MTTSRFINTYQGGQACNGGVVGLIYTRPTLRYPKHPLPPQRGPLISRASRKRPHERPIVPKNSQLSRKRL